MTRMILFLACLLFFSCRDENKDAFADAVQLEKDVFFERTPAPEIAGAQARSSKIMDEESAVTAAMESGLQSGPIEKKIIRSGNMRVEVDSLPMARRRVDSLLKKHQAYYSNETFVNDDSYVAFNLTVRVPEKNFDAFINDVEKGEGGVTHKSIQSSDVTEQFIDLEARLRTKRQFIERYHQLLGKAQDVKTMIGIQEAIRVLQEEIESTEGQLKYLTGQVNFSTLDLTLFKNKPYVAQPQQLPGLGQRLKNALVHGFNSILDGLFWLVSLWPLILLILILVFWIRKRWKRKGA